MKGNEKNNTDEVVIEIFEKEIQEKVSFTDIDRSHRLRKKHIRNRPQPIIVKFARYNVCNAIFKKKKILKGKAVSTTENLTKKGIIEMKISREIYSFENV